MAKDSRLTKRQLKKLVKEQTGIVKKDPNNIVARLKLAGALKDLGKDKEAVTHYQDVAKVYTGSGKLVQAISVYKGILEIKPGHGETEAALSDLSVQRAKEIKAKSMPRLQQQDDGRWVMPSEPDVSEEEGTDPGASQGKVVSVSPSVLRLPAPIPTESAMNRRRRERRSRPRLTDELSDDRRTSSAPSFESADVAPPPAAYGVPSQPEGFQPSLPSLTDHEAAVPSGEPPPLEPVHVPPAHVELPAEVSPPPVPPPPPLSAPSSDTMVDDGDARAERDLSAMAAMDPATTTQRDVDVESVRDNSADVVLMAEAPSEDDRREEGFLADDVEEPTSPGPTGYKETIRKSAVSIDVDSLVPGRKRRKPKSTIPKRQTLVGVPTPETPNVPEKPLAAVPPPDDSDDDLILGSVFDDEEEAFWSKLEGARDEAVPAAGPSKAAPRSGKTARKSSKMTIPMGAAAFKKAVEEHLDQAASEERSARAPSAGEVRLEEIALFRDLSETSREMLQSRLIRRTEKRGAVIVREGDPGNALFVVSSGQVRVTKLDRQGKKVELATLGPGAFFGEFALLSDRKRHATVTVFAEGVFFEISRKVIADLTKSDPAFGNTLRQFYRRRLLGTLVRSAPFFNPLSEKEREALMGRLRFRRIPEKTKIITEGKPGGGFFLILIGEVKVTKTQPDGSHKVLSRLSDGSYFGEMSLLKGGNAVAAVTTVTPTEIVQLAAAEFYRILSKYPKIWEEVNREAKRRELANLQILSGRTPDPKPSDDSVVM